MLKSADAQLCPICGGMVHLTTDKSYFEDCKDKGNATCIVLECGTCNLKMAEFSGITGGPHLDYKGTLDTLITRWNSLPQPTQMVSAPIDPSDYEVDETTTWLDLATKYKPNRVSDLYIGGVGGCPIDLGCYPENAPSVGNALCAVKTNTVSEGGCRACWSKKVFAHRTCTVPTVAEEQEQSQEYVVSPQHRMDTIIHRIVTTKECSIATAQELDGLLHKEKLLPKALYLRMNLLGGCMQVLTPPASQGQQCVFPFQSTFNFDRIEDIPDFLLQLYTMVDKYNAYLHKAGSVAFRPDKDGAIPPEDLLKVGGLLE